jgi:hypothetical protein
MTPYISQLIDLADRPDSGIEQLKALISLQCFALPTEWQDFVEATNFGARWSEDNQRKLRTLHQLVFRQTASAQPYVRVQSSEAISHYRGKAKAGKILVAFCGRAQVLFGPVARVLQYFPADEYEVLVLRDIRKLGFTQGLAGHSTSFTDMIDILRQQFLGDREVVCMGTSGGGGPALVAAALLSARSGVSFAGRPPTSSKIYGESEGAVAMEEILRHRSSEGQLHAVYPADHAEDTANAKTLSEIAPVKLWPMDGLSGHFVLHDLDLRNELTQVLHSTGLLY